MAQKDKRQPDFSQLQRVLNKQVPARPVLFEFILGDALKTHLTDGKFTAETPELEAYWTMKAFEKGGYDHSPVVLRGMEFPRGELDENHATKSLNEGNLIRDRASFEGYAWPSVDNVDFSLLDRLSDAMHPGMKLVPFSHDGILENTIAIVGYEALCLMLYDDPELLGKVFHEVGKRVHAYFLRCLEHDNVGALLLNDDWGFKSQPMVPPSMLREHVFPWYAAISEEAHRRGKHVILHSCGQLETVFDDFLHVLKLDGKHSFEDNIFPVEEAYEHFKTKMAIIGGLDIDFLCRATPDEVYQRARAMLNRSEKHGGYALGSGNSVPDFIPIENYHAMRRAALQKDR